MYYVLFQTINKMKFARIFNVITFITVLSLIFSKSSLKFNRTHNKNKQCNTYTKSLTDEEKQKIIDIHNTYRNQIATQTNTVGDKQPFAKNMIQMYWNDNIAYKAQEHANNCKFKHSTSQFRSQPTYKTGENIYIFGSSKKEGNKIDWQKCVDAWFNEIKDFKWPKSVDKFDSVPSQKPTGHFTQVIWANSYEVGCGIAQFEEKGMYKTLHVCQYGPVGNVRGLPIYESSTKKENNCPFLTGTNNSKYPGLCCPNKFCDGLKYGGALIDGTNPDVKKKKTK
jgi:hypothetical protein